MLLLLFSEEVARCGTEDVTGDFSFRDHLDLFEFRFINAKEFRHLDDLIGTYEIGGLSTESLDAGSKLAALHCLWDGQAEPACTFPGVKQTEVANDHFYTSLCCGPLHPMSSVDLSLGMRMNEPAYAIRE